ncbi:MAG: XdhC family protein [Phycisphaerae bacterium]
MRYSLRICNYDYYDNERPALTANEAESEMLPWILQIAEFLITIADDEVYCYRNSVGDFYDERNTSTITVPEIKKYYPYFDDGYQCRYVLQPREEHAAMSPFAILFRSIARRVDEKRHIAFCTIVGSYGSTPQAAGASMLLHEDITTEGTLGGGCVEAEVRKQAFELLQRGESSLLTFQLDHDYGWDDGLICGGTMRIAVQTITKTDEAAPFLAAADNLEHRRPACVPLRVEQEGAIQEYRLHIEAPAQLIIAGAGHVGAEVARLAVGLDFEVTVIDDRADLMKPDRLPPPIRPVAGDIEQSLRQQPIDSNTYVVIVTRGHHHDEQALHAVINSPARYIGMIGSRRKVKLIFDDLIALGVDAHRLERVHAPIGLKIGSVTVPEIAMSIVGQLIEVRRTDPPTRVEGPIVPKLEGKTP